MFYTTYFSMLGKKVPERCVPLCIARTQPRGIFLPVIDELKPSGDLLADYKLGEIDWFHYTMRYNNQLRHLDCDEVVKHLHQFGENIVLVCWEGPNKRCHRHLVSEWLNKHGYKCSEL